jgi:hypothetical protein
MVCLLAATSVSRGVTANTDPPVNLSSRMHRKQPILFFIAISIASALVGFAQTPKDEQAPIVAPVPRAIKYCLARMINENKTLELTARSQHDNDRKTFYNVSVPVILNGQESGCRIERREATQKVTSFRYSYCELDASTLSAYQPDGKRLSAQEFAEQLKPRGLEQYRPVILSDTPPDHFMAAVLANDCIVIVVCDEDVKFHLRNGAEN